MPFAASKVEAMLLTPAKRNSPHLTSVPILIGAMSAIIRFMARMPTRMDMGITTCWK